MQVLLRQDKGVWIFFFFISSDESFLSFVYFSKFYFIKFPIIKLSKLTKNLLDIWGGKEIDWDGRWIFLTLMKVVRRRV